MSSACYAIDLVTFDVGGTLLTFRPDLPDAYAEVLAEVGIEAEPARLETALAAEREAARLRRAAMVPPDHRVSAEAGAARRNTFVVNVLRAAGVPADQLARGAEAIHAAYDSPRMYQVYPDALPTIRGLWDRGLKLGIIANSWPSMGRILLDLDFGDNIGFWIISENVGVEKPHPEIFSRALGLAGTRPSQAVHVGDDYEADYCGARAAGMEAILLARNGGAPAKDADGYTVSVIQRLDALLDTIG